MSRQFVNRIPGYYESNALLYLRNWETRSCERKWKTCKNYHILTWIPDLGEPEPDVNKCEECERKFGCKCDAKILFTTGCKCGGK